MILEIAFVEVEPAFHSDFEIAIKRAVSEVLSTSPGFIDFIMHKGIEQPNSYTFHIHWETLEHHTIGFRESELFKQWRAIIGEYLAKPPIVEHWNDVSIL
jgi:heme-degrading monooxygenase HmoA